MANTITGRIHKITPTKTIISEKTGNTYYKREIILDASRFDQYTGEKKFDNFPMLEFGGEEGCKQLDSYNVGDLVTISFDLNGREYNDKQTGEVKYFTSVRGYKIEYAGQQPASTSSQAPVPQPQGNTVVPYKHDAKPTPEQPASMFPPQQEIKDDLPF